MTGLVTIAAGVGGAFVGWWAGLLLCPDWGDLGIGALPWAVGGALVGAVASAGVVAQLVS